MGLRKLSNKLLGMVVFLSASLLTHYLLLGPRGDVIGGWSVDRVQMHIGFARLLFPFFGGMLLMRLGRRIRVKGAFGICSVLIVAALAWPRFGGPQHLWMNGLYECFCIMILFPAVVAMGAGGSIAGAGWNRLCKFLGDISYPLYITHYPLIYVYTAWVIQKKIPAATGLSWARPC